nr:pilot protein for DNA ejection [Microvirus sp.]
MKLDPTIIAGGISTLGGLAGSLFGASKQDKNLKQSQDFQKQMWLMQNEYNSPVNQRKRFEEAGLNPNLMMNGSAASVASSVPSTQQSDSGNVMAQGISQATSNAAQLIAQQMDIGAQAQLRAAAAKQASAEAAKAEEEKTAVEQENQWRLNQLMAKTSNLHLQNEFQRYQNDFLKHSLEDRVDSVYWENEERKANIEVQAKNALLLDVQYAMRLIDLSYLDAEHQAQLANIIQDTATSATQAGLNRAATKSQIALAFLNYMQGEGIKIDNQTRADANRLTNTLLSNMVNSAYWKQLLDKQHYNDSQSLPNRFQRWLGIDGDATAGVAGYAVGQGVKKGKQIVHKPKKIGFR